MTLCIRSKLICFHCFYGFQRQLFSLSRGKKWLFGPCYAVVSVKLLMCVWSFEYGVQKAFERGSTGKIPLVPICIIRTGWVQKNGPPIVSKYERFLNLTKLYGISLLQKNLILIKTRLQKVDLSKVYTQKAQEKFRKT